MKQFNNKRKPFQGKQRHKDLREFKSQEIKKSLVHRARLRKNYFKLLEKEGAPETPQLPQDDDTQEAEGSVSELESQENEAGNHFSGSDDEKVSSQSKIRRSGPLPSQSSAGKIARKEERREERRKPMNFAERAKLARERKEHNRQEQLDKVREKRMMIEQSKKARELKKTSLSQRTKKGQPVMGPRITDLLEKIRQNN